MNIEDIIFEEKLENLIKKDEFGQYIFKSDLGDLKLSDDEMNFIYKILFNRGIDIKLGVEEPQVKNLEDDEFNKEDVFLISRILYDDISDDNEDYSKLEEYIDNVIIKNYVYYRRIEIDGVEHYKGSIFLQMLFRSGLSELELEYAIKYLGDKGIYVNGFDVDFDSRYDNYKYLRTYKSGRLPVNDTSKEQIGKFLMMNDPLLSDEERSKLRNELIETNIRLVRYVAYKYAILYNIDINELNSYGYEGLIHAVDNFDVNKGYKFSTYAISCIKGVILNGIKTILGFGVSYENKLFFSFIKIKDYIELETGMNVKDNPELVYAIVNKMTSEFNLDLKTRELLLNKILFNFCGLLELTPNYENIQTVEDIVFSKDLSVLINESLGILSEKELFVLKNRYGFSDGEVHSFREIGKKVGISGERARQIDVKSLVKLRIHFANKKIRYN